MSTATANGTAIEKVTPRFGTHGRVLVVDLTTGSHRVEHVGEDVYRQFLGGYGLGAYLMWKHFPARADALAPEACFAIVSGLLTGRAHAVLGSHPDRRQVPADGHVGRQQLGRQRREPAAARRLRRPGRDGPRRRSPACSWCRTAR